jgi:hypothetical protein
MKKLVFILPFLFFGTYGQTQTIDSLEKVTELTSVKVSGKRKRPIEIINERYTSGLFASMASSRTYDLINNPPNNNAGSILDYLQNILNNVTIRRTLEGYELTTTRGTGSLQNYKKGTQKGGSFESSSILLYLDEQPTESNVFFSIHPYDVALVKYFPPGQSQISFNQGMGVLAIYTRKIGDAYTGNVKLKKGELENMYKSLTDTSTYH